MPDANGLSLENIDILGIMDRIPHRYPFLMVDRVVDIVPFESAVGVKGVTVGEPHFQGHFPQQPIMPGVLIVESMAQTAAVMVAASLGEEAENKLVYFMSIEEAKFRRPVVPGDLLRLHIQKKHQRGVVWKFVGVAKVDEKVVGEAIFTAMIREPK